jgi:hypothetical protein
MLYDLFDSIRAGLREFRRLRWIRQWRKTAGNQLPF